MCFPCTHSLVYSFICFTQLQIDGAMHYCLGQYPQAEYLFQYVTEFVQRFHDRPYFQLFWLNSFSHNEQNMPGVMDARLVRFFQNIENDLNDTIVVFFSDHGMRFGKARETFVGWLEERMPFIYFHFPPSFRDAYPEKIRNLKMNKNRLTSPYDFHATLQEILYGRVVQTPEGCSKCDSLLKVAPWNRTCEDAGITSHWCTCWTDDTWSYSTSDPTIVSAAVHTVQSINNYLKEHKDQVEPKKECAVLAIDKIVSVISRDGKNVRFFKDPNHVIVFETKPSGALFEFTTHQDNKFEGIESISRINMYGNQSSCVRGNNLMQKFCYCIKTAG